jgi:hypothetical protein
MVNLSPPTDSHLFLEDEPLFNDKYLLNDRNHENVAIFPGKWHLVDLTIDWHMLDRDRLAVELCACDLVALLNNRANPDRSRLDRAPVSDQALLNQRKNLLFNNTSVEVCRPWLV